MSNQKRFALIGAGLGVLNLTSGPADNDILVYDTTTGKWVSQSTATLTSLNLGTPDAMTLHGAAVTSQLQVNSDTQAIIESHTHSATLPAAYYGARARGTTAAPAIVQSGDTALALSAVAYDGTDYELLGYILFAVDGTPGSNDMPGRITFATTPDGSFTPVERFRIDSSGALGIGGANFGTSGFPMVSGGSGAQPSWARLAYAGIADASSLSVLGRSANSSGVLADIQAGTDGNILRRSGTTVGFGSIDLAAAGAVGSTRLAFANVAQITGQAVLGVSTSGAGNLAAISAGTDDRVLRQTASALNFGQLTAGMFPNTVVPDAALSTNVALLSAVTVFTGNALGVSGAAPSLTVTETDGAADNKKWDFTAISEDLYGRVINDANSVSSNWVLVSRTGTTVDSVSFFGTKFNVGGSTVGIGGGADTSFQSGDGSYYISVSDGTREALIGADTNGALFGSFTAHDAILRTSNTARLTVLADGSTATWTSQNILPASTTSRSSLRLPHGAAPTSPVDGDMWTTTAGLYVRINGSTVGPLS